MSSKEGNEIDKEIGLGTDDVGKESSELSGWRKPEDKKEFLEIAEGYTSSGNRINIILTYSGDVWQFPEEKPTKLPFKISSSNQTTWERRILKIS